MRRRCEPLTTSRARRGYSGLYQFGASYNPGRFWPPASATPRSGNYLLYWMASQALWRVDPHEGKGLDATFAYDWSPRDVNRNNTLLTAGLRFNEPLPLPIHNTMSLGYVRNNLSPQYLPPGMPTWKTEQGVEFNCSARRFTNAPATASSSVLRECGRRHAACGRFRIQNKGGVLTRVSCPG